MNLLDFKPGMPVQYVRRATSKASVDHTGRTATVVRPVKSRKVVTIKWADTGDWYDADPANLQETAPCK